MFESITLIIGILFGLVWKRRMGWSCGGIITPGVLALYSSERIFLCVIVGVILAPIVEIISRVLDLYGTEKTGAAMIIAVIFREVFHVKAGFVLPALIARDVNRQGVIMTLCGVLSCTMADIFFMGIIRAVL